MVCFEDPKGTVMEVFKRGEFSHQKFPGRHGIGHNLFTYHWAPNGLITELFAQLDQMNEELGYFEPRSWHRDRPQRPKVWTPDPNAANYWGAGAPEEMRK